MMQYKQINSELFDIQLKNLNLAIENQTEVPSRIDKKLHDDDTPHKLRCI